MVGADAIRKPERLTSGCESLDDAVLKEPYPSADV